MWRRSCICRPLTFAAAQIFSHFPLRKVAYDRGGSYDSATYTAYVAAISNKRRTATPAGSATLRI